MSCCGVSGSNYSKSKRNQRKKSRPACSCCWYMWPGWELFSSSIQTWEYVLLESPWGQRRLFFFLFLFLSFSSSPSRPVLLFLLHLPSLSTSITAFSGLSRTRFRRSLSISLRICLTLVSFASNSLIVRSLVLVVRSEPEPCATPKVPPRHAIVNTNCAARPSPSSNPPPYPAPGRHLVALHPISSHLVRALRSHELRLHCPLDLCSGARSDSRSWYPFPGPPPCRPRFTPIDEGQTDSALNCTVQTNRLAVR